MKHIMFATRVHVVILISCLLTAPAVAQDKHSAKTGTTEFVGGNIPLASVTLPSNGKTVTDGTIDYKIDDGTLVLMFHPERSKKVNKCNSIINVQIARYVNFDEQYGDHAESPREMNPEIGQFKDPYLVPATTKGMDYWYLDFDADQKTPAWQTREIDGHVGYKISNTKYKEALFKDKPGLWGGMQENQYVGYEFITFFGCDDGLDCGHWYEGVRWRIRPTNDNEKGVIEVTKLHISSPPNEFINAYLKFNIVKKITWPKCHDD